MTLAPVLPVSTWGVLQAYEITPTPTSCAISWLAGEPAGMDRLLSTFRAAVRNPARLRRLADAPAVHARREGKIAGVVDRLRGSLAVSGPRGVRVEAVGGTELVVRPGQTFDHRRYLGAKLEYPTVIEEGGQDVLDVVRADLELDRIVTTADIRFDCLDPRLDCRVVRKPRLGLSQGHLRAGFDPSNEQQAQWSRRQCCQLALARRSATLVLFVHGLHPPAGDRRRVRSQSSLSRRFPEFTQASPMP